MTKPRTRTTSLWGLVEAMQRRLEREGLEAPAVDAEVTRGLRSLLGRDLLAAARRENRTRGEPVALQLGPAGAPS